MEAAPGSPSSDGNQSSTTSGYYSDIDYQRDDSHQDFQPSSRQDNRKRSGLTPSQKAEFCAKWPLSQYQANAGKYVTPWRQTIDDRSNANLMTPKWTEPSLVDSEYVSDESSDDESFTQMRSLEAGKLKRRTLITKANVQSQAKQQWHFSKVVPTAPGVKSATYQRQMSHAPKSSITATVTSAEAANGDGFSFTSGKYSPASDSRKALYQLSGCESYNSEPFAKKLMIVLKSVQDRQMDSKQQPLMRDQKIRSKLPVLQTRYSSEVWSEATTLWNRNLNFDGSSNDSIDTTSPFSKELHENGEGASRQDTLLASIREPKTIATQDENTESVGPNKELTALADASYATDAVYENLRSIESKQEPLANESSDADRNAETYKSEETTPVVETPAEMPQFIDPKTNVDYESIQEKEISPTKSPKTYHQLLNVPITPQRDEMIVPTLSDHCYNAPIGEERFPMPEQWHLTYIRSTNIDYDELSKDVILPPDRPMDCDYLTINVPVLLQHDALVEPIAQTEHIYMKSMDEKRMAATPQVSPAKCVVLSSKDSVPNAYIPAVSQSDTNEVRVPADLSVNKSIGEEKCVTAPQLPPAAFEIPSHQMTSLQQPIAVQTPNSIQPTAFAPNSSLPPAAFAIPLEQMTSLQQPIVVQMPNPIQPTAYGPSQFVTTQKRPYNRSKKVHVLSNIQITPPQSSIVRAPLKSTDPKMSNMHNNFAPIQMASQAPQELPVQYDAKSNTVNSLKRKIIVNSQPPVPAKVNFKSNEPAPSKVTAASLKRKNKENFAPPVPAKVQKVEKPSQVDMETVVTSTFSVNLPETTIYRVDRDDEQNAGVSSRAGQDSGNRAFTECLKFLQRNGVDVFKVPQKNNVSVERLNKKNVSRASNM